MYILFSKQVKVGTDKLETVEELHGYQFTL